MFLPPAPGTCCHSARLWPMRARPGSSLAPSPAESTLGSVAAEKRRALLLFFPSRSIRNLSPRCSSQPRLYHGERATAGRVCALLELQRACGYSHPEGWHVPLRLSERRYDPGRGRRWDLQSAVPAQTRVLLRLPLLPALREYRSIQAPVHVYYWLLESGIVVSGWHGAGDVCSCWMSSTGLCLMERVINLLEWERAPLGSVELTTSLWFQQTLQLNKH